MGSNLTPLPRLATRYTFVQTTGFGSAEHFVVASKPGSNLFVNLAPLRGWAVGLDGGEAG